MTSDWFVHALFYVSLFAWLVSIAGLCLIGWDEWRRWHHTRTLGEWDAQYNARPVSSAVGFVEQATPADVRSMYDGDR